MQKVLKLEPGVQFHSLLWAVQAFLSLKQGKFLSLQEQVEEISENVSYRQSTSAISTNN
jgi:hypothetical protein